MNYAYSQIDKDNLNWFTMDDSKASLKYIELKQGNLRGLTPFRIDFKYPLSVVAGKNGTGKTTLLAIAACSYHNNLDGYKLPDRKNTYYTFQDFFVQSSKEIPVDGIIIKYGILYNNWKKSIRNPEGKGLGFQHRKKNHGGKWNDYKTRLRRNVIYYGINRIVPHNEKSTSKSYKKQFENNDIFEWTTNVSEVVGRILSKNYSEFQMQNFHKYKLPVVRCNNVLYSGFNMGAGESALFEIFSTIFAAPHGTLIIIDEIELGLHGEAQTKLIQELKELCRARKVQIICTTHSKHILEAVPPEARFFVENFDNNTNIITNITPNYAGAKLVGQNSNELDIFVEDNVGGRIVSQSIDSECRNRTTIHQIGSASAIARQLAAFYKLTPRPNCIAFLDGDQTTKKLEIINSFIKYLESLDDKEFAKQWAENRIHFLLSENTWPEKCILNMFNDSDKTSFAEEFKINIHELNKSINDAILAGKHNEFFALSKKLGCTTELLVGTIINKLNCSHSSNFESIRENIYSMLNS